MMKPTDQEMVATEKAIILIDSKRKGPSRP